MMKKSLIILLLGLFSCMAFAQNATITGTVTGDNETLIGVYVVEKGTSNATMTDENGAYSIVVPQGATLVFSYVGFQTQEVVVGVSSTVNVQMAPDATFLDEIVVIGYGTAKKALLTGANANVKGEEIQKLSTSTAMEALQGIAPGVNISRNSGQPGAGTKVNIRGLGTISDATPLYIVDGVNVGDINYLNPSDIESIDVLKDAASAAIYGSRAANGVILVTTKKGVSGQNVRVSYDGYYGVQNIYKKLPALNAQEYMYIQDEMRINDGAAPHNWQQELKNNSWLDSQSDGLGAKYGEYIWDKLQSGWTGTDWVDEITKKNAPVQSHSINITGASDAIHYAMGFSYYDQTGIIGGDNVDAGYKRMTARINTDFVLFKNKKKGYNIITIGENLTYNNTKNKSIGTGNIYYNDLHDALVANPLMPTYWDESPNDIKFAPTLDGINNGQMTNPLASMYYRHYNSTSQGHTIVGNVFLEIQPIKDLKLRSSFGINSWFGDSRSYSPTYGLGRLYQRVADGANMGSYMGVNYVWTTTIDYKHTFGQDHNFGVIIGNEITQSVENMSMSLGSNNTTFGSMKYAYIRNTSRTTLSDITAFDGVDWGAQGGGIVSYFARASYNYKEKYMVDAVLRADGSSNFAPAKRWGIFPSVSAGWVLSSEDFMQGTKNWLDFAKLRASWGQNGNQNISNFIYSANIGYTSVGYYWGSTARNTTGVLASSPSNIANTDVSWETSEQLDLGIDARFFDSRLSLTFDWYRKMTKDWLVVAPIQGTSGASAPYINGGDIKNSGVELTLGWNDHRGDFTYGATVSGSYNKNEVTRIANAEGVITGSANLLSQSTSYLARVEVGHPIGFFYGYKTDGILQNQAEVDAYKNKEGVAYFSDSKPGDVRFVDANGDGVIDDLDKVELGDPNPDFQLGLQLNFDWKGIFLNTTLTGKFGMQVMQSYRSFADTFPQNYTTQVFQRWHGEGTSNTMPRLTSVAHRNNTWVSDIYMHDADFMRISNLTVGYDFRELLSNVRWLQGAKVYVSFNNLYTFTQYDGMDPDVSFGDGIAWQSGIDLGLYPLPRTILFGINLTF